MVVLTTPGMSWAILVGQGLCGAEIWVVGSTNQLGQWIHSLCLSMLAFWFDISLLAAGPVVLSPISALLLFPHNQAREGLGAEPPCFSLGVLGSSALLHGAAPGE